MECDHVRWLNFGRVGAPTGSSWPTRAASNAPSMQAVGLWAVTSPGGINVFGMEIGFPILPQSAKAVAIESAFGDRTKSNIS